MKVTDFIKWFKENKPSENMLIYFKEINKKGEITTYKVTRDTLDDGDDWMDYSFVCCDKDSRSSWLTVGMMYAIFNESAKEHNFVPFGCESSFLDYSINCSYWITDGASTGFSIDRIEIVADNVYFISEEAQNE